MTTYTIKSEITVGARLPDFTQDQVKNEPMFFNASPEFAYANGGPITKAFLDSLDALPTVFDSRVHMLMPGWFPCIPGYHHDDVPRSGPNGQPNYDTPEYRSTHALALINGDIAPTEFAIGTSEFVRVPDGEIVYKHWHQDVMRLLETGELRRQYVPSNQVVFFDDRAWHQGVRAISGGWRWFGRASWNTARKPTNEIRNQVQVYLDNPMEGW